MSLLSNPQELTANELDEFLAVLSYSFRIDAYNPELPDYKVATKIFVEAKQRQYTRKEFKDAVDKFIFKQRFKDFNPADFFVYERPMVYGRNEVLKLSDGTFNGFQRVECEGINVPIWIKDYHNIEPPLKKFVNKNFVNFIPH